jgi:hypothetical protein
MITMNNKGFIKTLGWLLLLSIILTACGSTSISEEDQNIALQNDIETSQNEGIDEIVEDDQVDVQVSIDPSLLVTGQDPPAKAKLEFSTDFSIHTVDYNEILSGGPPKDGIPAISNPDFQTVLQADQWLVDKEPVILLDYKGEVRAYPIQILIWHEIVNDEFGGESVIITFCPLCNTAIVFSGMINGENHTFGTTGRLRYSNLIMYDRQTENWWQQATGTAIAGGLTGTRLTFIPASMVSWGQFKGAHPDALVLSQDTGYFKDYGNNPYPGYDDVNRPPFLYIGPETPGLLAPVARVITVEAGEDAVAYPYDVLAEIGVVNDTVGEKQIVVIWQPGAASALDTWQIADGKEVGAVGVFSRYLNDQLLTFSYPNGEIVDDQTSSVWNVLGQAISGELSGEQLEEVVSINHFWFSWAAFRPDTRVYQP